MELQITIWFGREGDALAENGRAAAGDGRWCGGIRPGSVAWDVLLHPATIVFQIASQGVLQLTYKPIPAGVRDWDPLSRKARAGTLTIFDYFDRLQRNSGIHAPMWLGNQAKAERVAEHLGRIRAKVADDMIDMGAPELGGYRRATLELRARGHAANHKRVARMMREYKYTAIIGAGSSRWPALKLTSPSFLITIRTSFQRSQIVSGRRYHLHPNSNRLYLPGRCFGCLRPQGNRQRFI